LLNVDGVGFAAEKLAPGGVAQDPHVRVLQSAQDSGSHFIHGLVEMGMDTGDDDVHLRQRGVFQIE